MGSNIIDIRAMLNPYEMGLKARAFIAIKVDQNKRDEICNKLAGNLYVSTVISVLGDFDIFCFIHYQSWDQLNRFITDGLGLLDGVLDFDCYYVKEAVKFYHHLFGDGKTYKKDVKLNDLDWELIKQLSIDGRISNSELAKKHGLHASTISRRISSLVKRDLIRIMPQPNPAKFGFASGALITARVDQRICDDICKKLYQFDELFLILKVINRPYLIIGIHTSSNEILVDLIDNKIFDIPGIKKSALFVRSKVIKSSYGWYLDKHLPENNLEK
jgi:Lrp/AsnC family transcriptional regulator for asnA, asnC and gidA